MAYMMEKISDPGDENYETYISFNTLSALGVKQVGKSANTPR